MYELDIHYPKTLNEALKLKKLHGAELHILAGGTDLLVNIKNNLMDWNSKPSLLSLSKIAELNFVKETSNHIEIGPLVTHSELILNQLIQSHIPFLCTAAKFVGSPQIRNQGTIGGNIVNASPAADLLPVLYAREAEIEVSTKETRKLVPIKEFITGPGSVDLDSSGILTKIVVPKLPGYCGDYLCLRQRKAASINKVSLGVEMLVSTNGRINDIRIALGAVSPTVVRGRRTENFLRTRRLLPDLIKEACDLVKTECVPIDDIRSNSYYRSEMVGVLLEKILQKSVKL